MFRAVLQVAGSTATVSRLRSSSRPDRRTDGVGVESLGMIGEIGKMIRHNGQRFRRLKLCAVGASCLSHAVPTEPTYQLPQLIERDNNNAMSTPNANGTRSGVEGSQHSMPSSLSPIPDSQPSTTHSQSSTTHPPSSKPPTPHPQPLAFGPQLAFTNPQVSGDPQLRIDPPLTGIDSTPVPDSQTVADAPSHPDVRQDPPETSGSVAVGRDTGTVNPQPIIIHEYNQTMYDNATLIPDAVSAQIPSPRDSVASLLNRTTFPPMSSGSDNTGGEGLWKRVFTCWEHFSLWQKVPPMLPPDTFHSHFKCNLNICIQCDCQ